MSKVLQLVAKFAPAALTVMSVGLNKILPAGLAIVRKYVSGRDVAVFGAGIAFGVWVSW